jgi:modification methylase
MQTQHKVYFQAAQNMDMLADKSIDLVVTSPPYPMIEMWDASFGLQDPSVSEALKAENGQKAFDLMHLQLEKVWSEIIRTTKNGAFVCINIGDATRTLGGNFSLYSNHTRIVNYFVQHGFVNLPNILWRKPTNSPNKFMGSGMLPAGAYVTLEHEYILIFRKGGKRIFKTENEKQNRQSSAFFWEERNQWFSDLWELRGTGQKLQNDAARQRSGAYPFEIAYRLVNMFSVKNDTVLDPFLGTGTTTLVAMTAGRNSVGIEMDSLLEPVIQDNLSDAKVNQLNAIIRNRLNNHLNFIQTKADVADTLKHFNPHYGFAVMTSQERELLLNFVKNIHFDGKNYQTEYESKPQFEFEIKSHTPLSKQQVLAF